MSEGNDSDKDYEPLARALRDVFPAADYGTDDHTTDTWNKCLAELEHVLERNDPNFDGSSFSNALGLGSWGYKGPSKRDRPLLLLLAGIVGLPILWQCHQDAVMKARATGRSDVWAMLCEEHPRLAERLLPPHENGAPYLCQEFEHHFDKD